MSDCEETDFSLESWTLPGKRKRKKGSKKDDKGNTTMKTDESICKQKKKKNSKFKGEKKRKKAKIKEKKKKKKNRPALEEDDCFIVAQTSSEHEKPTVKPETVSPQRGSEKLKPNHHLTQDGKSKTKRKKTVAFDLPPCIIRAKRPKFVSSSPLCPKESVLSQNGAATDVEIFSQVTVTGNTQGPAPDNDSQCASEDLNSQDLFITQKTFRPSPSQPSSDEASDKGFISTPPVFTQRGERHTQDSNGQPRTEHTKKPKIVQAVLSERKKGILAFLTQMEPHKDITKTKNTLSPVHIKLSGNPYPAGPLVVSPSTDQSLCSPSQQSLKSTSTQTENLFTTELSSYLNFCRRSRMKTPSEEVKPLDLSLPQRARNNHKDPNPHPSPSSRSEDVQVKKEEGGKVEITLSPQSESESKSTDTTTSGEDNEPPCRTGKLDLTQVRAVQMRLNECFFFRTKGERQSPRPESPLMKLAQSRDVKSRKGR